MAVRKKMPDSNLNRRQESVERRADPRIEKMPERVSILSLLHRASQAVEGAFHRESGGDALTARQSAVLLAIAGGDKLSQTAIGAATGIDRSTLADLMRRLVKRGDVVRRRTREDARRYELKLTQQGQAAVRIASIAAARTETRIADNLGAADRDALGELLARLSKSLK